MKNTLATTFITMVFGLVLTTTLHAQSTAFTYQGSLAENAALATGNHDFEFRLFDAPTGGTQVGFAVAADDMAVNNGLFSVSLNFGALFDGSDRYLEIAVRPGASTDVYTTLSPRQQITAAPYALKALEATTMPVGTITSEMLADGSVISSKIAEGAVNQLGTPDGSNTSVVTVDDSGLVGVGTNSPNAGLHIIGGREIQTLDLLSVRQDESHGYTNLHGVSLLAIQGGLLAVAAEADNAVTLMDITTPAAPVLLSQIKDGDGVFTNLDGAYGAALSGNVLAVTAHADDAVTLIDVTDPASPSRRSVLQDGVDGFNDLKNPNGVAFSGNLLAVAARDDGAVSLVDVGNSTNAILRSVLKDGVGGINDLDGAYAVAFSGNLLAVAALNDDAVSLVDVSDPANPALRSVLKDGVGGINDLDGAYAVAFSGNLMAVVALYDDAVSLVDVSDPANPVLLSVLKDGVGEFEELGGARGVALSGSVMAVAAYLDAAVTLVDVAEPTHPVLLGHAKQNQAGVHGLDGAKGLVFHGTDLIVGGVNSGAITALRPTERKLSLASGDWVSIGTTRPLAPLHVVGSVIVDNARDISLSTTHFSVGSKTAATGDFSTAMGYSSAASGDAATAMGWSTVASGFASTAMGYFTTASGIYSTAMGLSTTASGGYSMAMGRWSEATDTFTIAAGKNARANHFGSFVWSDGGGTATASAADNSVTMRARGGFRLLTSIGSSGAQLAPGGTSWAVLSDRNRKKGIRPLDGQSVLDKLKEIPISTWHYDFEPETDTPHIGPMAQDFKAAFYPGRDNKTITTLEADGVALAAIQGLNEKLEDENAELRRRLNALERQVTALADMVVKK